MVCEGPDPPENTPEDVSSPSRSDLMMQDPTAFLGEDDAMDYMGYQPLAQEQSHSDSGQSDSDDDEEETEVSPPTPAVPPIEPIDSVLTREVWNTPRPNDPIQMDSARAEQVMSAMANFILPPAAVPEWARGMSEEQWRRSLSDTIHKIKGTTNR